MGNSLTFSQYQLANDLAIMGRVGSILKSGGHVPIGEDAMTAARKYISDIAAQQGLAEPYHDALEAGVENPGADATVITDAMLVSAVTAVMEQIPVVDQTSSGPEPAA